MSAQRTRSVREHFEIAFNEVQRSARYPGGVALRFARVKGYRPDKRPSEADTLETVRALVLAHD